MQVFTNMFYGLDPAVNRQTGSREGGGPAPSLQGQPPAQAGPEIPSPGTSSPKPLSAPTLSRGHRERPVALKVSF